VRQFGRFVSSELVHGAEPMPDKPNLFARRHVCGTGLQLARGGLRQRLCLLDRYGRLGMRERHFVG
jgi:hypothetical protein